MKKRCYSFILVMMAICFLCSCSKKNGENGSTTTPEMNPGVSAPVESTTQETFPGLCVDDEMDNEQTYPTETTVPVETDPPVTDATSPSSGMLAYESYEAMSEEQQIAFMESFESLEAFFEWYNAAKAEYEAQNPAIDVGDGVVDLGALEGNDG